MKKASEIFFVCIVDHQKNNLATTKFDMYVIKKRGAKRIRKLPAGGSTSSDGNAVVRRGFFSRILRNLTLPK